MFKIKAVILNFLFIKDREKNTSQFIHFDQINSALEGITKSQFALLKSTKTNQY